MAAHLAEWLTNDNCYRQRVAQLRVLKRRFGQSGASDRAADYILKQLGRTGLPDTQREAA
jgi:hypothetical protein